MRGRGAALRGARRHLKGPDAEDPDAALAALTRGGLLTVDEVQRYRWSAGMDAEQVRRLFRTFSDWNAEEVDRAAAAVQDLGGQVVEHYRSWLLVVSPSRRP